MKHPLPQDAAGMSTRQLFARFTEQEILLEQGRLLYALLRAFAQTGYRIRLFDNLPAEALGKYGRMVHDLDGVTLTDALPADSANWIYLHDRAERATGKLPWRAQWRVRYDLFSPYLLAAPVIMPFPMHPLQAGTRPEQLAAYRSETRRMRVFFSGDSKGYDRSRVRYPKPKLPRREIIQTVLERMGEAAVLLQDPAGLKDPGHCTYADKCVIADPQGTWIDPDDWLATLALSDFFLSPPGIVMPMCHNIVEAMAVGTIPITNYPEWFSPPLTHMRDCIVFDGKDDLIAKLRLALALPAADIARMKARVLDYYETQLRPEVFVQRIEARPERRLTLLMYTERNMALHAQRLGRHSVLLRHAADPAKPGWLHRVAAAFATRNMGRS